MSRRVEIRGLNKKMLIPCAFASQSISLYVMLQCRTSLIRPSPWLVCSVASDDGSEITVEHSPSLKHDSAVRLINLASICICLFLAIGYICFLYAAVTSEHGYGHDAIYLGGLVRFVRKDFGDTAAFLVFVEKTWSNPLSSAMKGLTNGSCAGSGRRWSPPSTLGETAGHRARGD